MNSFGFSLHELLRSLFTLHATQCSLHFDKRQKKIKFIAYIYIHFNENVGERSYISSKIEQENIYTQFFC